MSMTAAEAIEYARERIADLATDAVIVAELRGQGVKRDRAPRYVQRARESIARALDDEDVQRIRVAYIAGVAERAGVMRRRIAALELKAAAATNIREVLAIDRNIAAYMNLADRAQRNVVVALVPKEVRASVRAPTKAEVRAAVFAALDAPAETDAGDE